MPSQYDSTVVIYELKLFIRLATGQLFLTWCLTYILVGEYLKQKWQERKAQSHKREKTGMRKCNTYLSYIFVTLKSFFSLQSSRKPISSSNCTTLFGLNLLVVSKCTYWKNNKTLFKNCMAIFCLYKECSFKLQLLMFTHYPFSCPQWQKCQWAVFPSKF